MVKLVNGSRYYRALESVSIASALYSAYTNNWILSIEGDLDKLAAVTNDLAILPFRLPMPDPSPSNADSLKLQLRTARKRSVH